MKNNLSFLLIVILALSFTSACSSTEAKSETPTAKQPIKPLAERIDGYSRMGIEFSYYRIEPGLSREELITLAQKLHEAEPKASIILVDDDSKAREYIEFAKLINPGPDDVEMPRAWADEHIVANVQRYLSGKFVLCEGYGHKEIAELK
jgi:hypothetical protein